MPFLDKIKTIIYRNDLFSANANIRIKGQPKYQTLCGGFLSLFIIIAFIAIFASAFIDVLLRTNINTKSQTFYDLKWNKQIKNFMFAIGMKELDFTAGQQYFDVSIQLQSQKMGEQFPTLIQRIQLQPCSLEKWKAIDQSLLDSFLSFGIGKMLCPKNPQKLTILGYKGAKQQQYINIGISFCRGQSALNLPCKLIADTYTFINQLIQHYPYVELKVYWLDSIISQQNKDTPVRPYINTDVSAFFASTVGTIATISIGQFQIKTDQSISPFIQEVILNGNYVQQITSRTTQLTLDSNGFIKDDFVQILVRRTPKTLQVQRNYKKVDDMLSYIGGLFGLIIAFLAFFIDQYAQYSYQLLVAQNSFDVDYDATQNQFNFLTYCGYRFYELLSYLGIQPNWKKMKKIDCVRQQLGEQLDTRVIFKKLFFYQRATDVLLSEREKLALYFSKLPTMQQFSKMRQHFQSSQQLIQQFSKMRFESKDQIQLAPIHQKNQSKKQPKINTRRVSRVYPDHQGTIVQTYDKLQYKNRQVSDEFAKTFYNGHENQQTKEQLQLIIPKDLSFFIFQCLSSNKNQKEKTTKILQLLPQYIKNPSIIRKNKSRKSIPQSKIIGTHHSAQSSQQQNFAQVIQL